LLSIYGAYAEQEWMIAVNVDTNTAPQITSTPITNLYTSNSYTYWVKANDAEGDVISYSLSQFPSGMQINPNTGLLTWIPKLTQVGVHNVTVRVMDDKGAFSKQTFALTVIEVPSEMILDVSLSQNIVNIGDLIDIFVDLVTPYQKKYYKLKGSGDANAIILLVPQLLLWNAYRTWDLQFNQNIS